MRGNTFIFFCAFGSVAHGIAAEAVANEPVWWELYDEA